VGSLVEITADFSSGSSAGCVRPIGRVRWPARDRHRPCPGADA